MKDYDLSEYRAFLKNSGKSESTVYKYVRDVSLFISFLDGDDISKSNVFRFKKYLLNDYKARSARSILSSVNSYLDYIGESGCKVGTVYSEEKEEKETEQKEDMTLGEYYRLLSCAEKSEKYQLSLILQVLLTMGLKTGELKLLTVEAVRDGEVDVGKRQERIISIPDKIWTALLDYISRNSLITGPVFVTVHDKPIERSNLLRQIKRLCREAKVDESKVNPGSFRHLFACYYYEKTQDIEGLCEVLGIKNLNQVREYIGINKKGRAKTLPTNDLAL